MEDQELEGLEDEGEYCVSQLITTRPEEGEIIRAFNIEAVWLIPGKEEETTEGGRS
jgi:hypothetical protein